MFTAEIHRALTAAADLINTAEGLRSAKATPDSLQTVEGLKEYLEQRDSALGWPVSTADSKQLTKVRRLRDRLHTVWATAPVSTESDLAIINKLLKGVGTQLILTQDHGEGQFGSRAIPASRQINDVITATVAAALTYLVTQEETGRLRICRGDDCAAAIVDLTRNRSKLFCDFGNCANRAHVRAYRARQAQQKDHDDAAAPTAQRPNRLTKPSAAEKAEAINRPTSATAIAAKGFRDRMREELMQKRKKKS